MTAKHFVFDALGTRFHIYAILHGPNVVLVLPNFKWSYSVSNHVAPSAKYLLNHGACSKNRVDCDSLATWLEANWSRVCGNE